jgi:hypothetical protein
LACVVVEPSFSLFIQFEIKQKNYLKKKIFQKEQKQANTKNSQT